ncbi:hybrid sensor histidine kinase/response regulator [Allosphingosinicella vermicomposti]|uniref:hybrid sensor histidine kinase/response regulator n=1 Tax=Allosphingosinicella vermicomposti TaxID=614671 RepID=UPI000D114392|nr:PAS domain-containing sensor histidine kinase [Allosphingosinicella vermicomposti]
MAGQAPYSSDVVDQRFERLVNSVTDYAIYMLDADGHVATWNPGARRFKGYEADEIIGQHFSRFFTDEDRADGLPERALKTAAAEGRFEAEGWRVRKDGTRFWASAILDPIWDGGKIAGFAKVTRDITHKKQAERQLYESEQRFRMLVQGVRDYAIYMLTPQGIVSNWNSGAEAIKGYKAEEIVGQHFSRFYTDEDRTGGEPEKALATALREGKYEREAWRVRKDGTRFFASILIDPIYTETGELAGFAKITRDITERQQATENLEEARTALFQSQKLQALGELTGGIAHDFNNLMTVIRGAADLLRRGALSEEKRARYLDAIVDTADRASTLTSHLLAFGRRQPLKPEVVDLNLRMDAFGEVVARTLGSKIAVMLDLAPGLGHVEVDATQLETALLNAAINARDAMPDGGRITLSTANADDGRSICVAVSDTGTGMPQDVIARAFEPFFTTKPVGKGTGLGLSQIHGFAAQTGGRAEIESREGEGTTIRIILPRSDKPLTADMSGEQSAAIPEGLRVMLVEDNEQVRDFARHLLEELRCTVVSAASADEALPLIESGQLDLVFTDVVMPGMSGVEFAQWIREHSPEMPVLLASGYSEEVIEGVGAEFPMLRKPYGAEALSKAIVDALKKNRPDAASGHG